jgi:hypothetical protein
MRNDVKWFCENARSLERFSGRCVMFHPETDTIKVLRESSSPKVEEKPFVFHVPSKKELAAPVVIALKK